MSAGVNLSPPCRHCGRQWRSSSLLLAARCPECGLINSWPDQAWPDREEADKEQVLAVPLSFADTLALFGWSDHAAATETKYGD